VSVSTEVRIGFIKVEALPEARTPVILTRTTSRNNREPRAIMKTTNEIRKQFVPLMTKLWRVGFGLLTLAALGTALVGKAQTIRWQEDWESGAEDRWYADNGYWEIGAPTYGPPTNSFGRRTHQGNHCAATVLNGDYVDDRQSRLISAPIFVPTASQSPRLRFWHWWSFNCYDYGQVQISTNNGANWVGLSPGYGAASDNYDSSGNWTRAWLDLTPYAGRAVQIGFFFYSRSDFPCDGSWNTEVAPGWYVDEVMIESGPLPSMLGFENFEDALAGDRWVADFGVWEIGVPASGPAANSLGRRAHEGTNCLATILTGNYTDNRTSRVSSQPLVVPPAATNPRLRFWHWWSFNCYDYGQVQISTNNGASWIELSPGYGAASGNYDSSGNWTRPSLDLTPYAGQLVRIGFFFYSRSDFPCDGSWNVEIAPGWYVDEVMIESGPLAGMLALDSLEDALASDRWVADFGVWEIGVPTSGPATNSLGRRAHEGTNGLATILTGNYTDNRVSRISSQPFVVPPAATNPRLRFWHWWSFNCYDYGQVQISTNNGAGWIALATYASSSPWTQPQLDLKPYAGKTVRIAFFFYSRSDFGCDGSWNVEVGPGWYVDEIRLVHDFAAMLLDQPIVRTQMTACVSLGIAASAPSSTVNFVLQAPADHLGNPTLNLAGCWTGSMTSLSRSQWAVSLTNTCTATPMGVVSIGSICFTAISTQSVAVPLTIADLSGPPAPVRGFGSRAMLIADQPMLESWLGPNQQRMLTVYGKPNSSYEIRYATELMCGSLSSPGNCIVDSSQWRVAWTNTVSAGLFITSPVQGSLSNAPVLFFHANEK
jgi:hypothetical protein